MSNSSLKEVALEISDCFEDVLRSRKNREKVKRHGLEDRLEKDEAAGEVQGAEGPGGELKLQLS